MPNLALSANQIDKWVDVQQVDYPISIYIGFVHKHTGRKQVDKGRDIQEVDDSILVHIAQQEPIQDCLLYTSPSPRD